MGITYLDLDVCIERLGAGYRSRILSSPVGQAEASFAGAALQLVPGSATDRPGRAHRSVVPSGAHSEGEPPKNDPAGGIGGRLFDALFQGQTSECLRRSLDEAEREGAGLRIRLRLGDAPELVDLPWEYLYDASRRRFLALAVETPVVRYLDLPERVRPLSVHPPLRILVMIATPAAHAALDAEEEWGRLSVSLNGLVQRSKVSLHRIEAASYSALQRSLRRGAYHIFHFIGHGTYDERTQTGALMLEDDKGRGRLITGEELGALLHDEDTLRLAVLNACEGARTSRSDIFAGIAQSLVQQGIPAVVAMQAAITDRAAVVLAEEFYTALADGYPVDAALTEGRKAIYGLGNEVEWGTPVLHMRSPDGVLFELPGVKTEEQRMDPEQMARVVMNLVAPFVATLGGAVADRADEASWEKAQAMFEAMKGGFSSDPYAAQTLERLEESPESTNRQAAVAGILEEKLSEDPQLRAALARLLDEAQDTRGENITQQVDISGNAQTGDITQIGKVQGNVDLRRLLGRR